MFEILAVGVLLAAAGLWLGWVFAYPREQALRLAPARDASTRCEVLSVIPWRRGQGHARCWPLGLPSQRPLAFAVLHLVMAVAVAMVVVAGRHRRTQPTPPEDRRS